MREWLGKGMMEIRARTLLNTHGFSGFARVKYQVPGGRLALLKTTPVLSSSVKLTVTFLGATCAIRSVHSQAWASAFL